MSRGEASIAAKVAQLRKLGWGGTYARMLHILFFAALSLCPRYSGSKLERTSLRTGTAEVLQNNIWSILALNALVFFSSFLFTQLAIYHDTQNNAQRID